MNNELFCNLNLVTEVFCKLSNWTIIAVSATIRVTLLYPSRLRETAAHPVSGSARGFPPSVAQVQL